jgi:NADPH:quinone reductase-like Zn-dependent oxidoreductase
MDTGNAVHYSQWIIPEATGIDALKLENTIASELLGDDEVAVELHAASLNYRELVIAKACMSFTWKVSY